MSAAGRRNNLTMFDGTHTINSFLDAIAAKQPVPGGGSVAALAGALSAAMGEMVLNYSVGKNNLAAFEAELKIALTEFHRARQMLLELMVEDQAAYEAMTAVRKLPENSPERKEKFAPTLLACIRVPQAMAVTGLAILELCEKLTGKVNQYLLSDLAVCAELAMATVRCGLYNVRINLADVADKTDKESIQRGVTQLLSKATVLVGRTIPAIWAAAEA
jgi:formiminotetrahydrofolate cyclodeaminase